MAPSAKGQAFANTSSFKRSGMMRYVAGSITLEARPWVMLRNVVV
jgi:hypothetical protein